MAVLTENEIRQVIKRNTKDQEKQITISKGDIITPSAKSYINENNIEIKYQDDTPDKTFQGQISDTKLPINQKASIDEKVPMNEKQEKKEVEEGKYITLFGAKLYEKPEYMTHLRGNVLVFKDHPVIALRGKIDSLESSILEVQLLASKKNKKKLVEDLEEVISLIRSLIRCEVTGEPVKEFKLQGLTKQDLREQSHHPSKYFGISHFLPNYSMGEIVVFLNKLRTQVRETELAAFQAFKGQYGEVKRDDIIQALNRLSSLFWIMMFKEMAGKYDIGKE